MLNLNHRLTQFVDNNNSIGPDQAGFRTGFSTTVHIFAIKTLIDLYNHNLKKNYAALSIFLQDARKGLAVVNKMTTDRLDESLLKYLEFYVLLYADDTVPVAESQKIYRNQLP